MDDSGLEAASSIFIALVGHQSASWPALSDYLTGQIETVPEIWLEGVQ